MLDSIVVDVFVEAVEVLVANMDEVTVEVRVTRRVDVLVVDSIVFVSGGRVSEDRSEVLQPQSAVTTSVVVTVPGAVSASEGDAAQSSLPRGASPSAWRPPRPRTRGEEREITVAIDKSLILAVLLREEFAEGLEDDSHCNRRLMSLDIYISTYVYHNVHS